MKHIKLFESYGKQYHYFRPKKEFSGRVPTGYPLDRYNKEEATEHFYANNVRPEEFEYFLETEKGYKVDNPLDDRGKDPFIDWLRDNKGFESNDNNDIQYEYSATELDMFYNEYTGY